MPSVNTIISVLVAGVLTLGLITACNNKPEKDDAATGPHKLIPEEADSIESFLSEPATGPGGLAAKVKGKLRAPFMLRFQRLDSPYAEFPRSLHVDFYNDSMAIESQIDARYGKYLQNQDKVFLRDSVVVKNLLKRDTLHCKYLWWDQHAEKFYTDDSVRIYEPDKTLYGTGMEADQNFRWYHIKHLSGVILTSGNNLPK